MNDRPDWPTTGSHDADEARTERSRSLASHRDERYGEDAPSRAELMEDER